MHDQCRPRPIRRAVGIARRRSAGHSVSHRQTAGCATSMSAATAFWNRTLQELGSGFRLGPVTPCRGTVPEEALPSAEPAWWSMGRRSVFAFRRRLLAIRLQTLTIFLGESEFSAIRGSVRTRMARRVVGIRGANFPTDDISRNVARAM